MNAVDTAQRKARLRALVFVGFAAVELRAGRG